MDDKGEPKIPARLISLGTAGTNSVKLERFSTQAEYAALSYCWGAPQPNSLTAARLQSYEESVSISLLPRRSKTPS